MECEGVKSEREEEGGLSWICLTQEAPLTSRLQAHHHILFLYMKQNRIFITRSFNYSPLVLPFTQENSWIVA